jgi:1,6-anhydro-N-acetylmuramate kinase
LHTPKRYASCCNGYVLYCGACQRARQPFLTAVRRLVDQEGVQSDDVHVIGFHGQTIIHRPDEGLTWQIGNGALLAEYDKRIAVK